MSECKNKELCWSKRKKKKKKEKRNQHAKQKIHTSRSVISPQQAGKRRFIKRQPSKQASSKFNPNSKSRSGAQGFTLFSQRASHVLHDPSESLKTPNPNSLISSPLLQAHYCQFRPHKRRQFFSQRLLRSNKHR